MSMVRGTYNGIYKVELRADGCDVVHWFRAGMRAIDGEIMFTICEERVVPKRAQARCPTCLWCVARTDP